MEKVEAPVCEVCEKNESIGVACVPSCPVSAAYCRSCLDANAHPVKYLISNTACINGLSNGADWWIEMCVDTCLHLGIEIGDFVQRCRTEEKEMDAYFAGQPYYCMEDPCKCGSCGVKNEINHR